MMIGKLELERRFFMIRSISIGFNTMDVYDFVKTMYPGGNQLNTAIYAKWRGPTPLTWVIFRRCARPASEMDAGENKVDLTRVRCCTVSAASHDYLGRR